MQQPPNASVSTTPTTLASCFTLSTESPVLTRAAISVQGSSTVMSMFTALLVMAVTTAQVEFTPDLSVVLNTKTFKEGLNRLPTDPDQTSLGQVASLREPL
jgi:hypothetical protein